MPVNRESVERSAVVLSGLEPIHCVPLGLNTVGALIEYGALLFHYRVTMGLYLSMGHYLQKCDNLKVNMCTMLQ